MRQRGNYSKKHNLGKDSLVTLIGRFLQDRLNKPKRI